MKLHSGLGLTHKKREGGLACLVLMACYCVLQLMFGFTLILSLRYFNDSSFNHVFSQGNSVSIRRDAAQHWAGQ